MQLAGWLAGWLAYCKHCAHQAASYPRCYQTRNSTQPPAITPSKQPTTVALSSRSDPPQNSTVTTVSPSIACASSRRWNATIAGTSSGDAACGACGACAPPSPPPPPQQQRNSAVRTCRWCLGPPSGPAGGSWSWSAVSVWGG